jgi:proton-translocating NAD(P)+ transhydrogenase subunit alpha
MGTDGEEIVSPLHCITMFVSQPAASEAMDPKVLIAAFYVFALAAFLGYQVISRVPPLLHTPLMSATNAISGISLVGSLVIAGAYGFHSHDLLSGSAAAHESWATLMGFVAVFTATVNVVSGFGLTDRMLNMFRKDGKGKEAHK